MAMPGTRRRPRSNPNAKATHPKRPRPPSESHPDAAAAPSSSAEAGPRRPSKSRPPDVAGAPSGHTSPPTPPTNGDPRWIAPILRLARSRADARARELRSRFPQATQRELGERCVRSGAIRAGLLGAATSTLALIALPIGLPAGVALTLLLEAELLFTLIAIYGFSTSGEIGRLRLYAIWAGAGFADAAKTAGVRLGANAVRRVLTSSLPARIIARINPVLLRAILRRLGLGWLPRALKMWPLLGAPVGFVLDRAALRALGLAALDTLDESSRT